MAKSDIERRLVRIEELLAQLLEQTAQRSLTLPQGMSSQTARLIALARHDRAASIAESKRIVKAL